MGKSSLGGGVRSKTIVRTDVSPNGVARGPPLPTLGEHPHLLAKGPPDFIQGAVFPAAFGRFGTAEEEVPGGGFCLLILPGDPC